MAKINSPMEIFKLLNQSNCRDCNEKTCLAFSVAVFKGKRNIRECLHLKDDVIEQYGSDLQTPSTIDEYMDEAIENLRNKIREIDLESAAKRLGTKFEDNKLTLRVLGKEFGVTNEGRFITDIHVNPWITVPLLEYIIRGHGKPVTGNWVTFRDLPEGQSRYALYQQRCEKPLKRVADTYTDLFKDMLDIFDGKKVSEESIDSDISIVLHPLPLIPILISYWEPEEGMESSLHIFYDETAADNLDIDSLYTLTGGLVRMFEKLSLRHKYKI